MAKTLRLNHLATKVLHHQPVKVLAQSGSIPASSTNFSQLRREKLPAVVHTDRADEGGQPTQPPGFAAGSVPVAHTPLHYVEATWFPASEGGRSLQISSVSPTKRMLQVYVLQSLKNRRQYYVGATTDVAARIRKT